MAKINPVKIKQDADKLEKAGKLTEAIALYKQVIDDNPRDDLASWERAFAGGYRDGRVQRLNGAAPPKELLVANSDYALGFQAGYFTALQIAIPEPLSSLGALEQSELLE